MIGAVTIMRTTEKTTLPTLRKITIGIKNQGIVVIGQTIMVEGQDRVMALEVKAEAAGMAEAMEAVKLTH